MRCRRQPRGLPAAAVAALITAALALGAVAGLAGCATCPVTSPAQGDVPLPPAVGESVSGLSWATVRTGGPGVGGKFWQLLVQERPEASLLLPAASRIEQEALSNESANRLLASRSPRWIPESIA